MTQPLKAPNIAQVMPAEVTFATREDLARGVGYLMGCHGHRVYVGNQVHGTYLRCSAMARDCLVEAALEGKLTIGPTTVYT